MKIDTLTNIMLFFYSKQKEIKKAKEDSGGLTQLDIRVIHIMSKEKLKKGDLVVYKSIAFKAYGIGVVTKCKQGLGSSAQVYWQHLKRKNIRLYHELKFLERKEGETGLLLRRIEEDGTLGRLYCITIEEG